MLLHSTKGSRCPRGHSAAGSPCAMEPIGMDGWMERSGNAAMLGSYAAKGKYGPSEYFLQLSCRKCSTDAARSTTTCAIP